MVNSKFDDLKNSIYHDLSNVFHKNQEIPVLDIYYLYIESVYTDENIKDSLLALEKENKIVINGRKTKNLSTLPKQCTIKVK